LKPLPRHHFVLATWSTGKVGVDCHLKVGPALYSVPWRLIGQQLHARSAGGTVQILHENKVVATHIQLPKGRATDFEHYPPEKIAFRMRNPTWCRTRAAEIGPACQQVIAAAVEVNALFRLRAAQGVLNLAGKHGEGRLVAACVAAAAVGDPSYRTIKGILAVGAETDPPRPSAGDGGAAAHLHGPSQLFANVIALPTTNPGPGMDPATTSGHHDGPGDHEPDSAAAALA